ncbi:hypothetical protein AB6A23_11175 [Paenibacillus tarimensis]
MSKYRFTLDLQLFSEGGAAEAPAEPSGEPSVVAEVNEPSGDGNAPVPNPDDVTKQESFAKRLKESTEKALAEERAKWEAEQAEKFKDFDHYKKATEYLQKTSGISDLLTLKEQIELAELQERAEEQNVPPEVLKRIDQLEAKAAKGEELEAKLNQEKEWQEFETSLKTFCEGKEIDGKPVDHMELWKYMHENETSKPEVAFKAMKADILESKLETAKTDAINEYLKSKQGTKTEGSQGAAATPATKPAGSWKEAERRAMERIRASREAQ